MRLFKKGYLFFLLSSFSYAHIHQVTLEGCEDLHSRYSHECDSKGCNIVSWVDCTENKFILKSAIINADGSLAKVAAISAEGKVCYWPQLHTTTKGDMVAIWYSTDTNKRTYSLYGAMCPFEGSWTNPVCLSNEEEGVLANSAHLSINEKDQIGIFWESRTYYYAPSDPNELLYKEELRMVSGSLEKGWNAPITLSTMR